MSCRLSLINQQLHGWEDQSDASLRLSGRWPLLAPPPRSHTHTPESAFGSLLLLLLVIIAVRKEHWPITSTQSDQKQEVNTVTMTTSSADPSVYQKKKSSSATNKKYKICILYLNISSVSAKHCSFTYSSFTYSSLAYSSFTRRLLAHSSFTYSMDGEQLLLPQSLFSHRAELLLLY